MLGSNGSGFIIGAGGASGGSGTTDHSALSNRDLADQHPISAITNLQSGLDAKIDVADRGVANGVASLNASGLIPASQLSLSTWSYVVADIAARDALSDKFEGMMVLVIDATADPTVDSGSAGYVYEESGPSWIKNFESESIDAVVDWNDVTNKPATFTPSSHTHTVSEITDFPSPTSFFWREISTDDYTATPASTTSITFSDTSNIENRYPLRITYGSSFYYSMVYSYTTDTSVTIMGAPLDTGTDITKIEIGVPFMIQQIEFNVSGLFANNTTTTLLETDTNTVFKWHMPDAYILGWFQECLTNDTTTNPDLMLRRYDDSGSTWYDVGSSDITVSTTPSRSSTVSTTGYPIGFNDRLEIEVATAGVTGDAQDLSFSVIFMTLL